MTVVSLDMAYRSFRGGSGRLDTRLDTPPISHRHHPVPRIAQYVQSQAHDTGHDVSSVILEVSAGSGNLARCGPRSPKTALGSRQRSHRREPFSLLAVKHDPSVFPSIQAPSWKP